MKLAEIQEVLLSAVDRHRRLSLSSPFVLAAVLVVLYYVGGVDLRRLLAFMTFSPNQ
jgi:hypothetical protein